MKKKLLLCFIMLSAFAYGESWAQATVTGKVTDGQDGSAIPGVNVLIKGTGTGTITDVDGTYALSANGDAVLVFSFIGYKSQEITVGSRSVIDLTMSSDAQQLSEVIVTGSAVGKSKKTLSFSVGSISEELMTTVPAPNLAAGLQGKIAGLRVVSTGGQPGAGMAFQARAANSLSTGQQPLIIVDGAFLNGSTLADINPEDIAKIEVLKGSAGASLYGSQAANGVIQIFTKRGAGLDDGKTKVVYRGEFGVSQLANDRFPTANTHHYQLEPNGDFSFDGTGTRIVDVDQLANNLFPNYQDYQDILFRDGGFATNSLSMSGKNGGTNFFGSVQRLENKGVIDGIDGFTRNSFKLNVDHRINDKLDISTSAAYSTSEQDQLPNNGTGALLNNVLFFQPFYDIVNSTNSEDGSPYDWDIDTLGSTIRNPLYTLNNRTTTVNRTRLIGAAKINYDITDWLSANAAVSLDRSTNRFEQDIAKGYLSDDLRAGVQYDPSNTANGLGGGLERSTRINNQLTSRLNLVAQKEFGDFNTAFRVSYLYESLTTDFNSARGDDYATGNIRSLDNVTTNLRLQSNSEEIIANSFFAIADIDYQEKYIFSGLVRREGSSLFGPDERWANYFRSSFAYRLTEDFDIPGVQELKLRASYGTAGIRPTYEMRFETFQLRNGNVSPATLNNSFLKPAKSGEFELGLNASFLDRFNVEFNYVKTKTEDQILLVPLSGAAGYTGQWQNAGELDATSIELSLNTQIIKSGDFKWDLGINVDRSRQEVTRLDVPAYSTGPGNQQSTIFRVEQGRQFGAIFGQKFATSLGEIDAMGAQGLTHSTEGSVFSSADYVVNAAGYIVRRDELGTTAESPVKLQAPDGSDLVTQIGDINPDFRMGIANTFSWKNIKLYMLFDWKKGGDIYNQTRQWLFRDLIHEDVGRYPIATNFWNNLYNVNVPNSAFTEDGSFLMLRELSIAYTLDREVMSKFLGGAFQSVKFGLVGRNLFTITDYSGFHPDISSTPRGENQLSDRAQNGTGSNANTPNGDPNVFYFDSFTYPTTRTFTGSIQLTF